MLEREYWFQHGADVNARDATNWTPLHEATKFGRLTICKYLLEHGASVEVRTFHNEFPLRTAHDKYILEIYKVLEQKMGTDARI